MDNTIAIETSEDWGKIKEHDLKVVVDPMVFRTADVFLRGFRGWTRYQNERGGGYQTPEQIWGAISSNIGSLCAFFDALILEDRLPMYDYYITFPPGIDFGMTSTHWLVDTCNNIEETLFEVAVRHEAYSPVKEAAIAQINELPNIAPSAVDDTFDELSAFDYEWRPDLWRDYSPEPEGEKERVFDAFRFGGLLFSGYAQLTGSDHILQPKRSRLYLAASLGAGQVSDEEALFAELTKRASEAPEGVLRTRGLPKRPTFLPYLLVSDPDSPLELLRHAMELRKSGIVREYRAWWRTVMDDLDKGRGQSRKDEIDEIAVALDRKIGSKRNTKFNVQVQATTTGPALGVGKDVDVAAALGWFLRQLPGNRYRKLLMRMGEAQRAYWHIDQHLNRLWSIS